MIWWIFSFFPSFVLVFSLYIMDHSCFLPHFSAWVPWSELLSSVNKKKQTKLNFSKQSFQSVVHDTLFYNFHLATIICSLSRLSHNFLLLLLSSFYCSVIHTMNKSEQDEKIEKRGNQKLSYHPATNIGWMPLHAETIANVNACYCFHYHIASMHRDRSVTKSSMPFTTFAFFPRPSKKHCVHGIALHKHDLECIILWSFALAIVLLRYSEQEVDVPIKSTNSLNLTLFYYECCPSTTKRMMSVHIIVGVVENRVDNRYSPVKDPFSVCPWLLV